MLISDLIRMLEYAKKTKGDKPISIRMKLRNKEIAYSCHISMVQDFANIKGLSLKMWEATEEEWNNYNKEIE